MVDSSSLLQNQCCSVWLTFTQSRKNQVCVCWLNVWCSAALLSPEKTNWMEKDETALMKQLIISTHQNSFLIPTRIPFWSPLWFRVSTWRVMDIHSLHCHCSSKGRWPNWLQSALKDPRGEEFWTEVSSSSRCSSAASPSAPSKIFYESSQLSRDLFLEDEFSVWKTLCCNTWIIDVPPHARQMWEMVMSFVCWQ